MKFVLALLVLLHLYYSVQSNKDLNRDIIPRLERLNTLYKHKRINITSTRMMRVTYNKANAQSCVGVFVRGLKDLLNNVTVLFSEDRHVLEELEANLDALGSHQENNKCQERFTRSRNISLMPFSQYKQFFIRLNRN